MLPITLLMVDGELISGLVNELLGLGGCWVHHGCSILLVIAEGVQKLVWWVGGFIGFDQRFVWCA